MRITTFGDISIDVVLDVDHLPERGGEVFSSRRREVLGGSAVNTAVVLARLGADSAVMGAVGDDDAGHRALYGLGAAGVDTALTAVSQTHHTAITTILVTPDGERTIIGSRGANTGYETAPGWRKGLDWLHVSGYSLLEGTQQASALEVMDMAAAAGIPCSLDVPVAVGATIRAALADRLGGLRIVTGSRRALGEFTGSDDPVAALSATVGQVAMTSGADKFTVVSASRRVSLTPPNVDVVDVTGAGDAFVAGLIMAEVSNLPAGPTAVLAAAAGAAATLVPGASETLSDPGVWGYLLEDDRWSDADPAWLEAVRVWVASSREISSTPSDAGI